MRSLEDNGRAMEPTSPIQLIHQKIRAYEKPQREAFSSKYPRFLRQIVFTKRLIKKIKNYTSIGSPLTQEPWMPCILARHSSLLFRKLGESDPQLQINKVTNLKVALAKINGLVIPPGKTFSLWHQLGITDQKSGYVNGMLLSNGVVSEGIGGGLCQLSNFLFWIFLHTDTKIIERHHHSVDAFPDSGRTLPFGSGATIFSNYLDLQIKNTSNQPLQIKLWLTDNCLKGQIVSDKPTEKKFHLEERNHFFVKKGDNYFRFNEIYRETLVRGEKINKEKIVTNFAPVKYKVTKDYLSERGYKLIEIE